MSSGQNWNDFYLPEQVRALYGKAHTHVLCLAVLETTDESPRKSTQYIGIPINEDLLRDWLHCMTVAREVQEQHGIGCSLIFPCDHSIAYPRFVGIPPIVEEVDTILWADTGSMILPCAGMPGKPMAPDLAESVAIHASSDSIALVWGYDDEPTPREYERTIALSLAYVDGMQLLCR